MRTGKLVTGSVHDCNKKALERALKNFDSQLYLKWNPEKNQGVGLWELRRRPAEKTAVPKWELGKSLVFELEYVESDMIHHVMDLPALHFGVLDKLREMDMWAIKDFVSDLEYREEKAKEKELAKNKSDLRYNLHYHRRAMNDFKELVRSGRNPADFLTGEW